MTDAAEPALLQDPATANPIPSQQCLADAFGGIIDLTPDEAGAGGHAGDILAAQAAI